MKGEQHAISTHCRASIMPRRTVKELDLDIGVTRATAVLGHQVLALQRTRAKAVSWGRLGGRTSKTVLPHTLPPTWRAPMVMWTRRRRSGREASIRERRAWLLSPTWPAGVPRGSICQLGRD